MTTSQRFVLKYFSLQEAIALLDAALANNQFGWIVTDDDVKELMRRAILPHKGQLKDKKYKEIIEKITKE